MFLILTKLCLIVTFSYQCSADENSSLYRFKALYHFTPPHGWMNDPNGFSIFKGIYHLFFQYNPLTSQDAGIASWGHAVSTDLFHWEYRDIALYPDQEYDKTGVFSGSAIIENGTMYLIYTGNVNNTNEIPDHTQRQALAYSTDGENFIKYENNPIIMGEEYQPAFRDPKVWKHNDTFYMVLGNSYNNETLGRVLLFTSKDLISWEHATTLDESDGFLGYMWECPDFFPLGDYWVLLFSPQGMEPQGDKYKNKYQTGYIIGYFDYKTRKFVALTKFMELDHGHDFYATQTILDEFNRRIIIAWLDMWEQDYPERDDGCTGQMTLIRELCLTTDLTLIQKPIKEVENVRDELLYSGEANSQKTFTLNNNAAEILITAPALENFILYLEAENATVIISYDVLNGTVTLDRGGDDGIRRTEWRPMDIELIWRIFIDRSSIELFCGKGEVTVSSRSFPLSNFVMRAQSEAYKITIYNMKRTMPEAYK